MTDTTSINTIYKRTVTYSRKTPNLRYFKIDILKNASNQNYLDAVAPSSLKLERRNTSVGFSTYLPQGTAGAVPRAVGNLIAVDYDAASGKEYVYMLTRQGLMRSQDNNATLQPLNLPTVAPQLA